MTDNARPRRNDFLYSEKTVKLTLNTHLPTKWVAVDRETGDVWEGDEGGGWTKASGEAVISACTVLRKAEEAL